MSHGTGTCQDDTKGLDAEGSIKTKLNDLACFQGCDNGRCI